MAREVAYGVDVQIVGFTPLMMHKMTIGQLQPKANTPDTDYSEEWIKTCYTAADAQTLICPASNLESMLIAVSAGKKIRKTPLNKLVSQLNFTEFEMPLILDGKALTIDSVKKNNWIDIRGVVVQRNRVARARACIPAGWTVDFHIESRTALISAEYLKSLFEEAGELVGLMDYRPQRKGKFGQFEVSKFEVV